MRNCQGCLFWLWRQPVLRRLLVRRHGRASRLFHRRRRVVIGKSWSYRQWSVLKVGLLNDKSCSNQAWFLSQTSRVNISVPRQSWETTSLDTLSARTTSQTRRRRGLCTVPVHFACIWIHHLWNIHNCETSFPGSHRGQPSLSPRAKSLTDAALTRRSPAYR